jgi:putative membrane protein
MTTVELISNYWHFNIFSTVIAFLFLLIHLIGNRWKLNKQSLFFFSGLFIFIVATLSPLDFLAESYLFTAHMIKHIMLLLIVPPLLLSGMNAAYMEKFVRRKGIKNITNILFNPVIAWFCGIGAMWIWHIPGLLASVKILGFLQPIHLISLLFLGLIFNWPVFSPVPWHKLNPLPAALYLFTACVGCTVLGIFITFAPPALYTVYFKGDNVAVLKLLRDGWNISAETDQEAGGLIMWVPACMIYLTDIMISLAKWYRSSDTGDQDNNLSMM